MADYSITGDTKLDTSGFTQGISSMTVAAGTLIADLVKTATNGLGDLTKAAVGVGMKFEASMSQVAATMGTTTEDIQSLTDTAKELGRTTQFNVTQAAEALNYLALAGYDAEKAAEVLPSVLDLAAAGTLDLGYAADLVTDAMSALRIEATKANVDEFGDKLAMAASKANADVSQLGEAILTVGGTAANLKNGTTELTTALGLLANVGIKGAEGGTHLRNIILSLQSPVDDAAELMDALGLSVYDAQGNMRGLDEILTDLNASMEGMTQGEKDSIINRLFNKADLAAVNGLLEAQGEQWDTLAAYIDSADGAMSQMAVTQQDNLQGAKVALESAFEGVQLALYEQVEPTLTAATQMGTGILNSLTDAMETGGPEAMLAAAGEIINDLVYGIIEEIPNLLSSAAELIAQFCAYLGDHAGDLMDAGLAFVEQLIIGINENLPDLIVAAAGLLARFAAAVVEHLPKALECGAAMLTTLVDGILMGLVHLAEAALACVAELVGVWDGSMDEWGHIGENIVQGLLDGILGLWDGLVSTVKGAVSGLVGTVKKVLGIHSPSTVFAEIGENIDAGLAQGIENGMPQVEQAAEALADSVVDATESSFDDFWKNLQSRAEDGALGTVSTLYEAVQKGDWQSIGKAAAAAIYDGLSADRKQQIESFALGLVDQLNGVLGNAQEKLADAAWRVGESIYHGITDNFPDILDKAKSLAGALKDSFTGLKEPLSTAAKAISEGLSGGLLSAFPSIYAAMGGLITSIGAAFEGMLTAISAALEATGVGLPAGLIVAGAAVALGAAIAAIVSKLGGSKGGSSGGTPSTGGGSSGGSGSISGGSLDIDTGADDLADAMQDNTAALLKTNAALADMVRQADSLVLSDNMRLSSTVAASGTAQIRAAANNYNREGDTNITQNFYGSNKTAAEQQREARWEADRAKAQKR